MALTEKLKDIADAIRTKRGETGTMTLAQMPELIATIQSGGGGKTATVTINAPAGSTVTLTDGITTLTAAENDGVWVFDNVPYGLWTAVASLEEKSQETEITVVADISITINYYDVNTLMLINADNGSIVDQSRYASIVYHNGWSLSNVSKWGNGSFRGDNAVLYAYTPEAITGDFTVECWMYTNTRNEWSTPLSIFGESFVIYSHIGSQEFNLRLSEVNGSGGIITYDISLSLAPAIGEWAHVAWVRSGLYVFLFVNGSKIAAITNPGIAFDVTAIQLNGFREIGSVDETSYCNFEDLRVSNIARYTDDFTPPDKPFNL